MSLKAKSQRQPKVATTQPSQSETSPRPFWARLSGGRSAFLPKHVNIEWIWPLVLLAALAPLVVSCDITSTAKSAASLTYTEDAHKAYLEAMERCCQRGELSRERVDAILKRFNLRSEYFKPVFMLKEHGSRLERSLKVEG